MRYNFFLYILLTPLCFAQLPWQSWDSIKATTNPIVASAFASEYEQPYRQPLATYGWEDGIHISRDGLHLYALYYPGDLLSWTMFFINNLTTLTPCELLGTAAYFRPYAPTFGMDLTTNALNCDSFVNVDILYAHRASTGDIFSQWQLSGIARAGAPEGGPYPLFSFIQSATVDLFLFTTTSDIWMIRNTSANPAGIANAVRLPSPINPVSNEFSVDNPHLERLNGDTLLLVYEKYNDPTQRSFMYALSYDNGHSWTNPIVMNSITTSLGHIEHPHLYIDSTGQWWIYFSLNCDIYRAKQGIAGDWDSWQNIELVISKGNSPCIGEPSLTSTGDISFAVSYHNPLPGNNDAFDLDPWFLPRKKTADQIHHQINTHIFAYPNPVSDIIHISCTDCNPLHIFLFDIYGNLIYQKTFAHKQHPVIDIRFVPEGKYFLSIISQKKVFRQKIIIMH